MTQTLGTDKPSRLFWYFVLAQACAVSAAIFAFGAENCRPGAQDAFMKAAISDTHEGFNMALDLFSNDCGRLPTIAEGFQALITCPTNISQKLWKGPYIDPQNEVDPWGHEYVYRYPGTHNTNSYDLYSTGADGVSKSGGDDPDDINNWNPAFSESGSFSKMFFFALLIIPLARGVCSAAAIFSPGTQEFLVRNRAVDFVWRVISVIALLIFLSSLISVRG